VLRRARISDAAGSASGAITTSTKICAIASAVAASSARLTATMPPQALTGSPASALSQAARKLAPIAATHGLACLMIATAGVANSATSSKAASVSP